MSTAVDIVGVSGPGEGVHAQLDPETPLLIGRDLRGLEVPDPLVSLKHASIEWTDAGYAIRDLGSAKGTVVEGVRLGANELRVLVVGERIEIGGTVLEIAERHRRWRFAAEAGALGAMLLVVLGAVAWLLAPRTEAEVRLVWDTPIHQGGFEDRELRLDRPFVQRLGLDTRKVRLRRVTDTDHDGVDEVWLPVGNEELVVTFAPDGAWQHIARLPRGCADVRDMAGPKGRPMLDCGAVTFAAVTDGTYAPYRQDGVVLWGVPADAWDSQVAEPPSRLAQVRRASIRRVPALAGFLAANGIDEPVHYLLCDDVVPGLSAQAVTARGSVHLLSTGCRPIQVSGPKLAALRAVAFTETGRAALLDDVGTWIAGSPDGLFGDAEAAALIAAWRNPPGPLGTDTIGFEAPDHFFAPVAPEQPISRPRQLAGAARHQVPPATVTWLGGKGTVRLDPPGCALLEVQVAPWSCQLAQGCLTSAAFATVTDVGCGTASTVVEGTFAGGVIDGKLGDLDVRLGVDVVEGSDRMDVVRARLGWRGGGG